jgi:hypothetical protein
MMSTTRAERGSVEEALAALGVIFSSPAVSTITPPANLAALEARLRPQPDEPAIDMERVKRFLAVGTASLFGLLIISAILYLWSQRPSAVGPPAAAATQAAAPPAASSDATPRLTSAGEDAPAPPVTAPIADPLPATPQPVVAAAKPPSLNPTATAPKKSVTVMTGLTAEQGPSIRELRPSAESVPAPRVDSSSGAGEAIANTPPDREAVRVLLPSRYTLGLLHPGARAYVDRDAVFADFPRSHGDLPCIETAARDGSTDEEVAFELKRNAIVYVGYDRDIADRPSWLQAFRKTGETWSVLLRDEPRAGSAVIAYDVYARSYPKGNVNLGPAQDDEKRGSRLRRIFQRQRQPSMYLICVDPK